MRRLSLLALALAGAFASSAASAQNFTATLGYQNTDPASDNGTLATATRNVATVPAKNDPRAAIDNAAPARPFRAI